MAPLTAVLDACVIYPTMPRDLLVRLALVGLFRARWTDAIHDEWTRNLKADRPDLDPGKIDRTRALMDAAIRDCLVTGYGHLIPSISLPDPGDRHVVAAAIRAEADVIVTYNLADFPVAALAPYNIEPLYPDAFITALIGTNELAGLEAINAMVQSCRRPPLTVWQVLEALERDGLTQFGRWARETIKEGSRGMPGFG